MNQIQTVEMRLAYAWDCEKCGTENFERAIVHEFSPEEVEAMGEDAQTGNWLTHPANVTCRGCGSSFETKHFREQENWDE